MIETMTALLMALAIFSASGSAQEEKPVSKEKTADDILKAIDDKIWYGKREGLEDVVFDWKVEASGPIAEVLEGLSIRYAWKKPDHWITTLVGTDGGKVEPPPFLETESGQQLLATWAQSIHLTAQQFIVGQPLVEIYRDYYKELKTRVVNNEVEYRILLRPKVPKQFSESELRVVKGMPTTLKKTLLDGRQVTHVFRFEKIGDQMLWKGLKEEFQNKLMSEESLHYIKDEKLYLLQKIERYTVVEVAQQTGQPTKQVTRFENFHVNSGLDDAVFGLPSKKDEEAKEPKKETPEKEAPKGEGEGDKGTGGGR